MVHNEKRKKAPAVNHELKDSGKDKNLHYTDHSNSISARYLNGSKLHLNMKGTKILLSNFVKAIPNMLL